MFARSWPHSTNDHHRPASLTSRCRPTPNRIPAHPQANRQTGSSVPKCDRCLLLDCMAARFSRLEVDTYPENPYLQPLTTMNHDFFSKVFTRILRGRIGSGQWQAETPIIPRSVSHLRCFSDELLARAIVNEDFAYDIFDGDFGRLTPEWQKRVSGRTRAEWLSDEKAYRG